MSKRKGKYSDKKRAVAEALFLEGKQPAEVSKSVKVPRYVATYWKKALKKNNPEMKPRDDLDFTVLMPAKPFVKHDEFLYRRPVSGKRAKAESMLFDGADAHQIAKKLHVKPSEVERWDEVRLTRINNLQYPRVIPNKNPNNVGRVKAGDHRVTDALSFLRSAREVILRDVKGKIPRPHLYALLALDALEGE